MSNSLRSSLKGAKDHSSDRKTERIDLDKEEALAQFPRSSSSKPLHATYSSSKLKDLRKVASKADVSSSLNDNLDYTRSERVHQKASKKGIGRESGSSAFAKSGFRVSSE